MWPFGKSAEQRLQDALHENDALKNENVQVSVQNGKAVFTGAVARQSLIPLLGLVAQGISGVNSWDTSGVKAVEDTSAPRVDTTAVPSPAGPSSAPASVGAASPASSTPVAGQSHDDVQASSGLARAAFAAIKGNGELKDDPIDVLQSGRTVVLRGAVDSEHEKRLAENLVRAIDGVSAVDTSGLRVVEQVKSLSSEREEGEVVYTVKAGDTLGAIAQKYFGDAGEYRKIAHFNNISNPDLIRVGQKIRIPSA